MLRGMLSKVKPGVYLGQGPGHPARSVRLHMPWGPLNSTPSSLLLPHQCKLSPPKTCSFLGPPHPTANSRTHKTLLGSSSPSIPFQPPHTPQPRPHQAARACSAKLTQCTPPCFHLPAPTGFRTKPRPGGRATFSDPYGCPASLSSCPHTDLASVLRGITHVILAAGPLPLPESSTLSCCFSLGSPPLLTSCSSPGHSYCHNTFHFPLHTHHYPAQFYSGGSKYFHRRPESGYFPQGGRARRSVLKLSFAMVA